MSVNANISAFRVDLDKQQRELQVVLPKHIDLDGFCRIVLTAVSSNDKLAMADRTSLLAACMEAAEDGLLPDGREGAIVPYFNKRSDGYTASWQPMVWGLVKLVRQSGELLDLGAHIVTHADRFDYRVDEHGEHFQHHPDFIEPNAEPLLVYAFARTKDGGVYFEAMPWREVKKFRDLAKTRSEDTPWHNWTDEMAKVRVLKRLCKRLPMSATARAVLIRDDARDAGLLGIGSASASASTPAIASAINGVDPVADLNRAIRRGNVPGVPNASAAPSQLSVPALEDNPTPRATFAMPAREAQPAPAEAPTPPRSRPSQSSRRAQVADALNDATDETSLGNAARLIERVADAGQRDELSAMHAERLAELAIRSPDDGNEPSL
jgi:recombination protein RecT